MRPAAPLTGVWTCAQNVVDVYGVRLLQVRNPWGKTAWKGQWCDGSASWTQELRLLLVGACPPAHAEPAAC